MAVKRLPPDWQITQRRKEEESRAWYSSQVDRELNDKHFAVWVNTTHDKIQQRQKMQVADQFRELHHKTVEERRERLAALLIAEQEEYFKALDAMVETQDQRRQRLANCALELRQQRENRRKELAQAKMDQAFRENCEVLREAVSKVNLLHAVADRAQQLEWKEARKHELAEDDRIFDEMWEQERLKKVQRAQEDMERTHRMNMQLREQLKAQKEQYDLLKKREAEIQAEEDRIYKEQIELQLRLEAQREKERMSQAHALGRATRDHNEMLRAEKASQEKAKRLEDLAELQVILDQIKAEDERDLKRKMERREEVARYQAELKEQMSQEAESEVEMERLWQQETEKAWAKREAQWKREQEARNRLLKDVFEERARQLLTKFEQLKEMKVEQAREKDHLLSEMEKAAQIEAEQAQRRREFMAESKADLERQIAERNHLKGDVKSQVELERISAALAEEEFRCKVQKELDAVEAQKPRQFSHMRATTRPF